MATDLYFTGMLASPLVLDAANIVAQRNSTTAQTFRIYRTFTDSSNYERLALQSGSGYFEFASETAGTGTDDIDVRLTPAGIGRVRLSNTTTLAWTGTFSDRVITPTSNDDLLLGDASSSNLRITRFSGISAPGIVVATGGIGFVSSGNAAAAPDANIRSDGTAGILAQRNSTNAQTFRLYRTFTDSSNYQRLAFNTGSTTGIAYETAGTGATNADLVFTAAGIGAVKVLYTQGDAAVAPFYVDCSGASISNGSVMRLTTSSTGGRKAFQALKGSDTTAWASFEFPDSGVTAPGFALGDGSSSRDVGLFRINAGVFTIMNGNTSTSPPVGGALEFIEQTAPSSPAVDRVRMYAVDNGGVTELQIKTSTSNTGALGLTTTAFYVQAGGAATDVDVQLIPKGSGAVRFGVVTTAAGTTGSYITIKDSAGNSVKLAVFTTT